MSRSTRIQLIVVAVILAVVAAPFLIPLNVYRAPLERAASAALSREVHIGGPLHLTVYPDIGLSLSDVSIANVPGARAPQMVTVENLIVGAKLLPLFSGRLEVTELTFQKPVIHLETGRGASNWTFGRAPSPGRPADAAALNRIGFSHMNIRDGAVSYDNTESGKSAVLSDVSLSLDMPERSTLARPLTLGGALTYNGQKLNINGRLDNFGGLLDARGTGGRISIGSNVINAEFTGTIGTEGISGALKLGAHSVRSFAAWMGKPLPPGNGFGLVALEGQFTARDGVYSLTHTHLAFDSMNVNGDIAFDTNPDILTVRGHGAVNRLDINPYLAPGASTDTVKAARAKAENPDAPLALGGLKAVNADLTLVLGELVLPNLKLEQAVVKTTLKDGVLKADMNRLTAYGGTGTGSLTVDASGDTPVFAQTLEMSGIKVQPFLTELTGVDNITGTGAVRFDIASRGDTAKAIVSGLNGSGEIRFADGNIAGVDLAGVARVLKSVLDGGLPGDVVGGGARTGFARMGASFNLRDGVVRTNDFQLASPTVQIGGRGAVDLSAKQLEFHFVPKAEKGILGVPFFVKGPWVKPTYGPDVAGLAKGIVESLASGATSPLDLLREPGLSLKSILGTERKPNR